MKKIKLIDWFKFRPKKTESKELLNKNSIYNFKLSEFLQQDKELINKYVSLLNYVKPKKTKRQVFHMKLKHVEFIKKNLNSKNDEAIIKIVSMIQKIKKEKVFEMLIIDFFSIVKSIKNQLAKILDVEIKTLIPSFANVKWDIVQGSERMAKFEILNTYVKLIKSYGKTIKYWSNRPYSEIYAILYLELTSAELQEEMNNIKLPKQA